MTPEGLAVWHLFTQISMGLSLGCALFAFYVINLPTHYDTWFHRHFKLVMGILWLIPAAWIIALLVILNKYSS